MLISDGKDPAVDQSDGTSSLWDLNDDGIDDTRYSATKANITAVFDELAGKNDQRGHPLHLHHDHGGNNADTNPAPFATATWSCGCGTTPPSPMPPSRPR